jgi:hypothetical protein
MATLTEQYERLKKAEEQALRLRTEAETLQRVAQQRVEQLDAEIRALGVNPETAEQEILALEAALSAEMTTVEAQLAAESDSYRQIIAAAKAAGLQA